MEKQTNNKNQEQGYKFYRKPSIKKKAPEVRQTKTSVNRMLQANPLMKFEKDSSFLSKLTSSSTQSLISKSQTNNKPFSSAKIEPGVSKAISKYPPLKKRQDVPKVVVNRPGSKSNENSRNTSPKIEKFNALSHRQISSNKLGVQPKKNCGQLNASEIESKNAKESLKAKKSQPVSVRRSFSAQHFDFKKRGTLIERKLIEAHSNEDVFLNKQSVNQPEISTILESSREASIQFKTPMAYQRRSIANFTPRSSVRRSIYHSTVPLADLQRRLNDWLKKRGKNVDTFKSLKCFNSPRPDLALNDDEDKENVEVLEDLIGGSYEDLGIVVSKENKVKIEAESVEGNLENVAKAAMGDLLKLIQDGYPRNQCEGWLELIRQKYKYIEDESQYWECRAAIEQSCGNILEAVEFYKTAIVQGAEVQSVDESLDLLLRKFSLLNINTDNVESEKTIKERARIVKDARNIFKSSIIQFAVQERKLKGNGGQKKLIVTPVKRSTRRSRSLYTSTPSVKLCASLQEIDPETDVKFEKNKALV